MSRDPNVPAPFVDPDVAARDATLDTLSLEQRAAVREWLYDEIDFSGLLASYAWEHAWLPEPGSHRWK